MGNLFMLLAASNAANVPTEDPGTAVVILIGFGLVLVILTIMVFVLSIESKIFTAIDAKKKGKSASNGAVAAPTTNNIATLALNPPVIGGGISAEVVAAIAAALACMETEGGRFEIRSITRAKGGRGAWNMAGTVSYTDQF